MQISATDVKKLRDLTGFGMMEVKRALEEVGGDVEKATEVLRARGAEIATFGILCPNRIFLSWSVCQSPASRTFHLLRAST